MVAALREGQWGTNADGRTRYRGQPRRGRQLASSLNAVDGRLLGDAIVKAEDQLVAYLETHPMTAELVEVLGQLDLAARFAAEVAGRRSSPMRRARLRPALPVIGR